MIGTPDEQSFGSIRKWRMVNWKDIPNSKVQEERKWAWKLQTYNLFANNIDLFISITANQIYNHLKKNDLLFVDKKHVAKNRRKQRTTLIDKLVLKNNQNNNNNTSRQLNAFCNQIILHLSWSSLFCRFPNHFVN